MKIVFVSNFMSHHQLPISQEFILQNGTDNYVFIALEPINKERLDLGYEDMNTKYSFVLRAYENTESMNLAKKLLFDADIVIWGSAPYELLEERLNACKITFKYSERIFRRGKWTLLKKRNRQLYYKWYGQYINSPFYLLSAGAYASEDFQWIHAFENKALKWGYFPPLEKKTINELLQLKNKDCLEIVWCARFIELKHPESVVYLTKFLSKQNLNHHITMIGGGELLERFQKIVIEDGLDKNVTLLGSVPADEVRKYMDRAHVLLFTSDSREGWGAVMNEGMNSACVPVVSHEIGSAPYLVSHGKNGLIFESKNWKDMSLKIAYLIINKDLQSTMAIQAYNSIMQQWNAENAVSCFINICGSLMQNKPLTLPLSGPCSCSEILRPNDIKDMVRKKTL